MLSYLGTTSPNILPPGCFRATRTSSCKWTAAPDWLLMEGLALLPLSEAPGFGVFFIIWMKANKYCPTGSKFLVLLRHLCSQTVSLLFVKAKRQELH